MRWDPEQYLTYRDHRSRPFRDLMARVPADKPRSVIDLGCGPGNLTAELAASWPHADVLGLDASAEMIDRAETENDTSGERSLHFVHTDLTTWRPDAPADVVVSNATLQWVPDHLDLLPELLEMTAPGGWFAFQVPGNFGAPSHTELAAVCAESRWRDRLADADLARPWSAEPEVYLAHLAPLVDGLDVWETTYVQILPGEDAVLSWMKGTGLRPVLGALDDAEATEFLAEYAARLRVAYPPQPYGTVLPYRRIFVVARAR